MIAEPEWIRSRPGRLGAPPAGLEPGTCGLEVRADARDARRLATTIATLSGGIQLTVPDGYGARRPGRLGQDWATEPVLDPPSRFCLGSRFDSRQTFSERSSRDPLETDRQAPGGRAPWDAWRKRYADGHG